MAVFIGDIYRAKNYHILSADLANKIATIDGFVLKSNLIWFDQSKLYMFTGIPTLCAFNDSSKYSNI